MSAIFYRLFRSRYDKLQNLRQFVWNRQASTCRRRNTYLIEQMENRYLLSADAAPLALSAELLNEELMVEQLIDAGLAEASNTEDLKLVRQHDYELTESNSQGDNETSQAESIQPTDTQTFSEQPSSELADATSEIPQDTQAEVENVQLETDLEATEQTAESAETIQYLQQLNGHQFVVIDRSVEDYRALLSTFMGEVGGELEWRTETTDAGDVLVADWYAQNETTEEAVITPAEIDEEPLDELLDVPEPVE